MQSSQLDYLPILMQAVLAIGFVAGTIAISGKLGPKRSSKINNIYATYIYYSIKSQTKLTHWERKNAALYVSSSPFLSILDLIFGPVIDVTVVYIAIFSGDFI